MDPSATNDADPADRSVDDQVFNSTAFSDEYSHTEMPTPPQRPERDTEELDASGELDKQLESSRDTGFDQGSYLSDEACGSVGDQIKLPESFPCTICPAIFPQESHLIRHQRCHTGAEHSTPSTGIREEDEMPPLLEDPECSQESVELRPGRKHRNKESKFRSLFTRPPPSRSCKLSPTAKTFHIVGFGEISRDSEGDPSFPSPTKWSDASEDEFVGVYQAPKEDGNENHNPGVNREERPPPYQLHEDPRPINHEAEAFRHPGGAYGQLDHGEIPAAQMYAIPGTLYQDNVVYQGVPQTQNYNGGASYHPGSISGAHATQQSRPPYPQPYAHRGSFNRFPVNGTNPHIRNSAFRGSAPAPQRFPNPRAQFYQNFRAGFINLGNTPRDSRFQGQRYRREPPGAPPFRYESYGVAPSSSRSFFQPWTNPDNQGVSNEDTAFARPLLRTDIKFRHEARNMPQDGILATDAEVNLYQWRIKNLPKKKN